MRARFEPPADQILRVAGERRAIIDRFYGMLRRRARIDWWIARTGASGIDPARGRIVADLALADKLGAADIAELFSGSRHCPEPLDDRERALADALAGRPIDHPGDMPPTVQAEIPDWLGAS